MDVPYLIKVPISVARRDVHLMELTRKCGSQAILFSKTRTIQEAEAADATS